MQEITVFGFSGRDVRVMTVDGEPWWVAKDVCEVLGLADASAAVKRLDDDEKLTRTILGSDQGRDMWLINESGLYSLILRSRKVEAKTFKRWVTHEVLPTIRKTGSYAVARDPLGEVDKMAAILTPALVAITGAVSEVQGRIAEQGARLAAVEEQQRITDPLEIERRMHFLENCKTLLVFGTRGQPQPVTFPGYWRELKNLIGIASFQNRAVLTVPMMDKCVAYAARWCEARGVNPPTLFDQVDKAI